MINFLINMHFSFVKLALLLTVILEVRNLTFKYIFKNMAVKTKEEETQQIQNLIREVGYSIDEEIVNKANNHILLGLSTIIVCFIPVLNLAFIYLEILALICPDKIKN